MSRRKAFKISSMMIRHHGYHTTNLGPPTFTSPVLLLMVQSLPKPFNLDMINSRALKTGMIARLTTRKAFFLFSSLQLYWNVVASVFVKSQFIFCQVKLQILNDEEKSLPIAVKHVQVMNTTLNLGPLTMWFSFIASDPVLNE